MSGLAAETERRLKMLGNGYDPTVTVGKRAIEEGWPSKVGRSPEEIKQLATLYPSANGTGFNNRYVLALDADITDPEAATFVFSILEDQFGDRGLVLHRGGTGSKFMVPVAIDEPMTKVTWQFKAPNGVVHQIEARGDGQQSMAHGYNPDAKRDYFWKDGRDLTNTPRSELPKTNPQEIIELLNYIDAAVAEQFNWTRYYGDNNTAGAATGNDKDSDEERDPFDADTAVAHIRYGNIDDTWQRCVWSLLRLGTPADDVFSRLLQAAKDAPACQADPRRARWPKALAEKISRALRDEPDFVACLSYEMQIRWHHLTSDGHHPRLTWRPDLQTLYVVKSHGPFDDAASSGPDTNTHSDTDKRATPKTIGIMLNTGYSVEEIVAQYADVLRHDVEQLCFDLINSDPALAVALPDYLYDPYKRQTDAGNTRPQIVEDALHGGWCLAPWTTPAAAAAASWPTPYSARPTATIPRRKWLWGTHYFRGGVTITAAPGATGKSQHSLVEAVGMAAGRDLITGEVKKSRLRVWVWNAEDDIDEQERRVAGICEHYNIDRESLRGYLFLDSGHEVPFEFAAGGKVTVIRENILHSVAEKVRARGIDVVIFDPLVALHTLPENDNTNLAKIIRALGRIIAQPCNCAVELVHHTRKAGKGDDSPMVADDMRGATTIVFTPRSGRLLHPMSVTEAEKYGIDSEARASFVRLERAKPNMAKRGTIYWLQLVIHTLNNAGEGEPADTVSVPALWTPADVTDKITDASSTTIRDTIAKGEFRRDVRAGNDWAGRVVGRFCNLDLSKRHGRAQAEAILSRLIARGVLATEYRTDRKTRKTKEYVVPGGGP
jgi:hypothetical protein